MSVDQKILMDNRDLIISYLDADSIVDQLVKANLISQNAARSLIGKSKIDKNRIVFEQLSNAGPGALENFRKILKNQRRRTDKLKELEERKLTGARWLRRCIDHRYSSWHSQVCINRLNLQFSCA